MAAADDLREAVELHRRAVELMTESTELTGLLVNLGMTLHGLAAVTADPSAYVDARDVLRRALAEGRDVAPGQSLDAALAWQRLTGDGIPEWPDVAAATEGALDAIRKVLGAQALRADKEAWLRVTTDVAAACARAHAELGHAHAAAVALERGRGLILSESLPPFGLASRAPDLLARLRRATTEVNRLDHFPEVSRAPRVTLTGQPNPLALANRSMTNNPPP